MSPMAERFPVPVSPPVYSASPAKFDAERPGLLTIVDVATTSVAAVLTLWYTVLLGIGAMRLSLAAIGYSLACWAVLTYIALPRIHQLLTRVYVPGYFIGRTRTGDGLLGDPVNLALDGSEADIHAVMLRAGWTMADEITAASAWGIVKSSLLRRSYPEAPVSDLFLFGERHAFAYQQEVDGNASQRHHVRFWRVPDGWLLPGGHRVEWLAAGTYDRSVGLSLFTGQVTHKIDADIDLERNYIINTIRYADPECGVRVIKDFSTSYHSVNGGGDRVHTDGDLPVLTVRGAAARGGQELVPVQAPAGRVAPSRRPLAPTSLWVALVFSVLQASLVALLWAIVAMLGTWVLKEAEFSIGTLVGYSALLVVDLTCALSAVRGREWGLVGLRCTYTISAVLGLWSTTVDGQINASALSVTGVTVLVLWAISGQRAQRWVTVGGGT